MERSTGFAYRSLFWLFLLLILASTGWAQTVTVSAMPTALTIHPGDQNVPVTVSVGSSTYIGPIAITVKGLPSGITVSPLTLTAGTSGTLFLSASPSAAQESFPATGGPYSTTSNSYDTDVVAIAGLTVNFGSFKLTVSISNPAFAPAPGAINLPIVTINTNGVPIVDKTTNVPGTITITSANGQTSYLPNSSDTDNTGTFHLHGNTTVLMPKKPYHVKLNTSLDLLTTMGLSCPYVTSKGKPVCDKSKSYVLLANYDDKTFLRDWSASALANAIPIGGSYLNAPADSPTPSGTTTLMPWAPHSLFVELYLNGAYQGNYQLIEEVKVDGNKININELAETDTTDDITGGYLVEIDARQDEDYVWTTPQGLPLGLIDPDYTPEVPEQTSYITNYTDTAENALFSATFTNPTTGWRAYYDDASAVNFYIVNDLMGNVDGGDFFSSDYFYKSQDNPLLYMGPVWDFDISSGNVNYKTVVNPAVPWMQTQAIWYVRWFKDPSFEADVTFQWNALKNNGVFADWLASIPEEAATLQQSQINNFGRWPMQGLEVWPNPQAAGSYNGELAYLTNWLTVRMGYLDSQFNKKASTSTTITVPSGTFAPGALVTLRASVTGGSDPTGSVAFLSNNVILGLSPLGGNGMTSFTTSNLPAGANSLEAVYVGDNNNALSISPAAATTVSPSLLSTVTSLNSSLSTVSPGNPPTLSVVVVTNLDSKNTGTSVPTGMVSFTANGVAVGAVPLASNGTATFAPRDLLPGTVAIQALYSGDSIYHASSSNILSVFVSAVAPPGNPFDFGSGFADADGAIQLNGSASLSGSTIQLTNGPSQAGSAFYTSPVNVQAFTTDFNFQLTNAVADGFTFTIQNISPTVLGGSGSYLGYRDIGKSVAIKFDLYNNAGEGFDSTGIYIDGAIPTLPAIDLTSTAINLHSGDQMDAYITYDGTTLNLTITDLVTRARWSQPFTVNIPATVGGGTAYIGFTGGTGGLSATQQILNWSYQSGQPLYYPSFRSAIGLTLNGNASISGTVLQLTGAGTNEAGSAFYASLVNVQSFTTDFNFQLTNAAADGFTFTIQDVGPTALGGPSSYLGYRNIGKSVAIKFDLFSNSGEGPDSTGIYTDGAIPTVPAIDLTGTGINLHSGDKMDAHLTYDGTTLTLTITDLVTLATWSNPFTINIPAIVGGNTAYVGFTGGTGGGTAIQQIITWKFVPGY